AGSRPGSCPRRQGGSRLFGDFGAEAVRGVRDRPERGQRARARRRRRVADCDRRIRDAGRRAVGLGPVGARAQRPGARARRRDRSDQDAGERPWLRLRRAHGRRRGSGQRKLAPSRDRRREGWVDPDCAAPSAGLSLAPVARLGRILADRLRGPKPADRVHSARAGLPETDDGGDRSAILDRAAPALRPVVQGTAATRAHQDHGRRQALGAAAFLRPRHPPGRRRRPALFAAQPCRRDQPWRRRRRRTPGRPCDDRKGPRADIEAAHRSARPGIARMSDDIVLSLTQATKLYAGVPAIEGVDFDLRRGEIHALVGENGAGKSTLTKVMAGVVTLTSGTMTVDGVVVSPQSPLEARHLGIGMVFQENSLVPTMTVAQNLYLGQERFYNRLRGIYIAAQSFLQSLNFDVTPTATVGALGAAKKQMVEIARAVLHKAKVIIFDEPTATLTPEEKKYFLAQLALNRHSRSDPAVSTAFRW